MINNPFNFFDKIYCINLPNSKDRWEKVSKEFKNMGIFDRVERIYVNPPPPDFEMSNFKNSPGEFGVWLSQTKALMYSIHNQNENFLLLEDDVTFISNTHEILRKAISQLPCDWDIFYIGGRPLENLITFDTHIYKTNSFLGGYAYAVNSNTYIDLLDVQLNNISKPWPVSTCDTSIAYFSKNVNSYCTIPLLCENVPGDSIIQKKFMNYEPSVKKHWKEYT